jgi:hypothetical protein
MKELKREMTQVAVRVPAPILEKLRVKAEKDLRSVNSQILAYVASGLDKDAA